MVWRYFLLLLSAVIANVELNAQCVVINEILINGPGACDGNCNPNTEEWTELYNTCSAPVDLSCCVLTDGDFIVTFAQGTILNGHDYLVIGSSNSGAFVDVNLGSCACATGTMIGTFTNGNEQLMLLDPQGQLWDAIYWGAGQFPLSINSTGMFGCGAQSVNVGLPDGQFELLPEGGGQGCTLARSCDGSAIWEERCAETVTMDSSNGVVTEAVITPSGPLEWCEGEVISLTAVNASDSYSWWLNGQVIDSDVNSIQLSQSGDYWLTTGTPGCESISPHVEALMHPSPDVVLQTPEGTNLCATPSLTLLANPGFESYHWYVDGALQPDITLSEWSTTSPGVYEVEVSDEFGCTAVSNEVELVSDGVDNLIIESSTGEFQACQGIEMILSIDGIWQNVSWDLDGVALSTGQEVIAVEGGLYTASVINDAGCTGTISVAVLIAPLPVPIIAPDGPIQLCEGEEIGLFSVGEWSSYQWQLNGTPIPDETGISVNASTAGLYTLVVNDGVCEGESNDVEIILLETDQVIISASSDAPCEGSVVVLSGNAQFASYLWSTGEDLQIIEVTSGGVYSLEATDANGCHSSTQIDVQFSPLPFVDAGPDLISLCGAGVVIVPETSGTLFSWSPETGLSDYSTETPFANPVETTTYYLTVTEGNCTATDEMVVYTDCADIIFPNVFTPNGDGENDELEFVLGIVQTFGLTIFNRWGQIVFSSEDPNRRWDGNFAGNPAPEGTYFYILEATRPGGRSAADEVHKEGAITLLR